MTGSPHSATRCGSITVCRIITVLLSDVVVPVKQTLKGTPLPGNGIMARRQRRGGAEGAAGTPQVTGRLVSDVITA